MESSEAETRHVPGWTACSEYEYYRVTASVRGRAKFKGTDPRLKT